MRWSILARLRSGGISNRAFFLRIPSRRGNAGEYDRGGEFWRMRFGSGRESIAPCSAMLIQSFPGGGEVGSEAGVGAEGNTDAGRTFGAILPNAGEADATCGKVGVGTASKSPLKGSYVAGIMGVRDSAWWSNIGAHCVL